MPLEVRENLLLIGGVCLLFGMVGWALYAKLFSFAPTQDFMVFYTAARSCIEGNLPLIFDGEAFTARINEQFGAWFATPLNLHPWVYPPLFLLMVLPLGLFPFIVSYSVWMVVTFLALNGALRCHVPPGYRRVVCAAGVLLSPAAAFTVGVGQNAFLTTALLVGGFGLIRRSAVLAGVLLGVLACKPQLWLLVPVALLAAREWRVLTSALATATLLALTSAVVFGPDPWREWLTLMLWPNPAFEHWVQFGRLNGQSIYTEAILLGLPEHFASLCQVMAIVACAGLVLWCHRPSGLPRDLQLAILLIATTLAAPHVSNYDAVMVAVAVLLFLCRALKDGFRFGDSILIIVVWCIEVLDPPRVIPPGLITPLVYCLFLAALIARGGSIQTDTYSVI
ncbi:MAG: glycosyltransferase family 87 protein [Rhodopila sp.]